MTEISLPPDDSPKTKRSASLRLGAAIVVVVGITLMWIYVFAAAGDYHPAGWLKDRTFPTAAEKVCAPVVEDLNRLPVASDVKTPEERAELVEKSTALLRGMQEDLRALVPTTGKDAKYIRMWVDDWTTYLGDRDDFVERLRTKRAAEFMESQKEGTQLSKALDNFADVNKMPSCATPRDV